MKGKIMKKLCLTTLYFALLCNTAFAQTKPCVYEWCDARLPKAGEKVIGKDNCGNVCSKHGIAVETPAVCSTGINEWDYNLYIKGYRQKAEIVGNELWIHYEK